jgi:peptide/nickel transport system permease protein
MLTMIGKRLMFAIPSLIGVVIVTFLLTRALPGDPRRISQAPPRTRRRSSRSARNSASTGR